MLKHTTGKDKLKQYWFVSGPFASAGRPDVFREKGPEYSSWLTAMENNVNILYITLYIIIYIPFSLFFLGSHFCIYGLNKIKLKKHVCIRGRT